MKITDEMWLIKRDRQVKDSLAYMTHAENNAAFQKRKGTGLRWVIHRPVDYDGEYIKNVPTSGFKISDWNTRSTTDNKVFDILDPRGFTVQIKAQRLFELLHMSKIEFGEVMGECVWGSDDGLALIPIDSATFKQTVAAKSAPKITMDSIDIGDIVKSKRGLFALYLGKIKRSWKVVRRSNPTMVMQHETKAENLWFMFDDMDALEVLETALNDYSEALNIKSAKGLKHSTIHVVAGNFEIAGIASKAPYELVCSVRKEIKGAVTRYTTKQQHKATVAWNIINSRTALPSLKKFREDILTNGIGISDLAPKYVRALAVDTELENIEFI
jgi:hypothetical protein